AELTVAGHLLHVQVGDEVQVTGWISVPPPPANPGEWDTRERLRRQGAGCRVRSEHPDSVRKVGTSQGGLRRLQRMIARVRNESETLLARNLSLRTIPMAGALLLGDRSKLTDEVRTAFAESGMMHILAI